MGQRIEGRDVEEPKLEHPEGVIDGHRRDRRIRQEFDHLRYPWRRSQDGR